MSAGRRWRLVLAHRDAVPASVRRFTARARRRKARAVLPLLLIAGGLVVVLAALLVIYQSPLFTVRTVKVDGAGPLLSADAVRRAAGVAGGTPLASVDLDKVAGRVRRLPAVRTARVERDWPQGLAVRVTPRTAVGAVLPAASGGSYRLVDASGVLFGGSAAAPGGVPLLRLGRPGPGDASTRAALSVLAALTPQLRAVLVRVEAPQPTRVALVLSGGRTVVWGDASANARKAQVATVLLSRSGNTIDVSAPDVVTVR